MSPIRGTAANVTLRTLLAVLRCAYAVTHACGAGALVRTQTARPILFTLVVDWRCSASFAACMAPMHALGDLKVRTGSPEAGPTQRGAHPSLQKLSWAQYCSTASKLVAREGQLELGRRDADELARVAGLEELGP